MPYRHEACTLLRSCASECRVTYLMRILPPCQIASFMREFDSVLRKGFEDLIGKSIEDKWWRVAKLPAKFGGMAMRSGLKTFGAQHIVSLIKTSEEVCRIVGPYDACGVAKLAAGDWLTIACGGDVTVEQVIEKIQKRENVGVGIGLQRQKDYSVAQLCERHEYSTVCELMYPEESIHIKANSGPGNKWVTVLPLSFKRYDIKSAVWRTSVLKRLRQDVLRVEKQCTFCKWSRGDLKGEHAIMCSGGCSRNMRHNTVRDLVAKAVGDVGYTTDFEHGGGLGDHRRPGDVIVYNWSGGKHLLIDVAVINPLAVSHASDIIEQGVGGAATAYESIKINTYPDIDFSIYDFVPFIIESCGGVGKAALKFCKELDQRREAKEYWKNNCDVDGDIMKYPSPLLTAINLEVQRFNSRMILERQPPQTKLIDSAFIKCEAEVAKKKIEAAKSLSGGSYRAISNNRSVISNCVSNLRQELVSVSCSLSDKPYGSKWPPDPPDPSKESKNSQHTVHSTVFPVEHPLAIKEDSNSQSVSATTKANWRVSKQRFKEVPKVSPKRVLRNRSSKDPDAVEWEPPERT